MDSEILEKGKTLARKKQSALKTMSRKNLKEILIEKFFFFNGLLAILILLGIFSLLFIKSFPAVQELGWKAFFGSAVWNPTSYEKVQYGILSLITSTLMVTLGAMLIAVPLGVACAAFISEV